MNILKVGTLIFFGIYHLFFLSLFQASPAFEGEYLMGADMMNVLPFLSFTFVISATHKVCRGDGGATLVWG